MHSSRTGRNTLADWWRPAGAHQPDSESSAKRLSECCWRPRLAEAFAVAVVAVASNLAADSYSICCDD